MSISVRPAQREDTPAIYNFICDLAEYEKAREQVACSADSLARSLFDTEPRTAHALMVEAEGVVVGYAVYFYNFSTWTGERGIYLEDLYIDPAYRGRGAGKLLMRTLARQALEQGCHRFEWAVLDWNQPSIEFYESIGARHQSEWLNYRMDGEALRAFGAGAGENGKLKG